MGIRSSIYRRNQHLLGFLVADAGADVSASDITTITLDSTASTSSIGTINSWSWEVLDGNNVFIDTPTTATTTLTGGMILGDNLIQLTITDDLGNVATDTIVVTIAQSSNLLIGSSVPDASLDGSITLKGGLAAEVVGLEFKLFDNGLGDSVTFTDFTVTSPLDFNNTPRLGTATLDGNGFLSGSYNATKGEGTSFSFQVRITYRDAGEPFPTVDRTTVVIP